MFPLPVGHFLATFIVFFVRDLIEEIDKENLMKTISKPAPNLILRGGADHGSLKIHCFSF